MRSEIAKKILSETPQEVKDKVRKHGDDVVRRVNEVYKMASDLSEDEIMQAKLDYASTKWHRLNTATIDFKPESKVEENK